jgi:hypothetical protein
MTVNHLYPTTRPTLDLNFARQKRLDPRVTFTRGSTATYVGDDGLIKTAASNEARFDHDPATGESLGLLVEEARTNNFLYSTELDNAYWDLAVGISKTTNNAVSPDGNTTALLVTEDTSTGGHKWGRNLNVSVSNNCMSIFVKPNGKTKVGLAQGTSIGDLIVFDLTGSGSVISGSGLIELYANGWYRITNVRSGNGNKTTFHLLNDSDNAISYTGDGTSGCWIWGYQKEAGTFPTSLIPTTSSTVTRSADVASMTGTNFSSWYNQSEGTVFSSITTVVPSNVTNGFLFQITDGTSSERIELRQGGSGDSYPRIQGLFRYLNSTTGSFLNQETGWNTDGKTLDNIAFAWDNSGFTLQTKFDLTPSTGTGSYPQNLTQMLIAHRGHINRLTYYPTRLTDSQLQELTR